MPIFGCTMKGKFKNFMIRMLMLGSRVLGAWFLRAVAYTVTAGLFSFRPKRVGAGMDLYRAVFPGRGRLFYLLLRLAAVCRFHGNLLRPPHAG